MLEIAFYLYLIYSSNLNDILKNIEIAESNIRKIESNAKN